jgi:uncharacterized protein YndB with AHSA1/START domain
VNSKRASADITRDREDTIVREIHIKRPAEEIFEALTKANELVKWWRVEGKFQITQMECDFSVGGKWKMHLIGCGGTETVVSGEYREIVCPHLVVFTWIRETEDATETLVRWELKEKDGVTTVRVTHSGLTTESLRKRNDGWPMILGLLQAHLEKTR